MVCRIFSTEESGGIPNRPQQRQSRPRQKRSRALQRPRYIHQHQPQVASELDLTSSDSGTVMASPMVMNRLNQQSYSNHAYLDSRSPSLSAPRAAPQDPLYAQPIPRRSRSQLYFSRNPSAAAASKVSVSSTGTFQAVNPDKPWNGLSTTIVNVDTHERHEWTDTEDCSSVKVRNVPSFFQNRAASNPNLMEMPRNDEPFNYIAFSQQLYGQQKASQVQSQTLSSGHGKKSRAVSYV